MSNKILSNTIQRRFSSKVYCRSISYSGGKHVVELSGNPGQIVKDYISRIFSNAVVVW